MTVARRMALGVLGAGVALWLAMMLGSHGGTVLVSSAEMPSAMAPLPDGGLLYGELRTGRIRSVDRAGRLLPDPVSTVAVSTGGQRGLLGLAIDGRGRVFAAWTDPEGTIVVGQVGPGSIRMVWRGPESAQVANGGSLVLAPDGRLLIGIGDSPHPFAGQRVEGSIVSLDPDGAPSQVPLVVSSGWHNPFAMAYTPDGDLWVADNAPGEEVERLARGDVGPRPSSSLALPPHTAPSGLTAVSDRELVLCGYGTRVLQRYRIGPDGMAAPVGRPLATDCSLGVVVLSDGRLAYADAGLIRAIVLPAE